MTDQTPGSSDTIAGNPPEPESTAATAAATPPEVPGEGPSPDGGLDAAVTGSATDTAPPATDAASATPDEAAAGPEGEDAPLPAAAIELLAFADLALPPPLLRAIESLGFPRCTPIQSVSLPFALADYDITGQAQTGTGKTAAFLITAFTKMWERPIRDPRPNGTPRTLVLAPTRELAMQIARDAEGLGAHLPFRVLCVMGGVDFDRQLDILRAHPVDVLVATPGRLIDFVNRRAVDLSRIELLVIDEADRMLDMGFIPDVRRIVYRTPHKYQRQTLFFSATFNDDVLNLARQWTLQPEHVAIAPERIATDSVHQEMYLVSAEDKLKVLYNLIQGRDLTRAMVFANRRDATRDVHEQLNKLGVGSEMLSGEVPQRKRISTLERFRSGQTRVLVATDVAGRGIHVDSISHVINYNLPEDPEDYVHRIGRTGRAGATGTSISLACEDEAFKIPEIETLLGMRLSCVQPPAELLRPLPGSEAAAGRPRSRGRRGGARRRGEGGAAAAALASEAMATLGDDAGLPVDAVDAGDADGDDAGHERQPEWLARSASGDSIAAAWFATDDPADADSDDVDQADEVDDEVDAAAAVDPVDDPAAAPDDEAADDVDAAAASAGSATGPDGDAGADGNAGPDGTADATDLTVRRSDSAPASGSDPAERSD